MDDILDESLYSRIDAWADMQARMPADCSAELHQARRTVSSKEIEVAAAKTRLRLQNEAPMPWLPTRRQAHAAAVKREQSLISAGELMLPELHANVTALAAVQEKRERLLHETWLTRQLARSATRELAARRGRDMPIGARL